MLVEEIVSLGGAEVEQTHGGVGFRGDWRLCYRINLESRLATRVLWRLKQGRYRGEEDIYRLAYSVPWAKWFTPQETMRVYVVARHSPLKSLNFVTLRIKDAVCDHFRSVTGQRPRIDTANPDVRLHAFLTKEGISLYLDTSGESLVKRGFKHAAVEAPLKENLAAGLLRASGWSPGEPLVDPMCGSGTFLIEAAQMALDIAPGLERRFAFERFRHFDASCWSELRRQAEARRQLPRALPIYGSDIVASQIERARINLAAAGLAECVTLQRADLLELQAPAEAGVMVTNPPYGVRIGERSSLADWYPRLGDALKLHWAGWRCYFFSGDAELPKLIGLKASRRTPFFNGPLECRLYEYRMIAGSMRSPRAEKEQA